MSELVKYANMQYRAHYKEAFLGAAMMGVRALGGMALGYGEKALAGMGTKAVVGGVEAAAETGLKSSIMGVGKNMAINTAGNMAFNSALGHIHPSATPPIVKQGIFGRSNSFGPQ